MDPYDVLGLLPDATPDQIRAAYRRLAAQWHPDHQPPEKRAEAVERMVLLNAARDLLLDARRRVEYHRVHEDALRQKMARAHWQAEQAARPNPAQAHVSWAFREERERQARRRFYGRLALSLTIPLLLLGYALPSLLGWASDNSPELQTAVNMMEASFNVWLALIGGMLGMLFFAVVFALIVAGLGRLLKR